MAEQDKRSKVWRIVAVVFFGLTVAVTLLSGLGTTCVAFAPNNWGANMAVLAPYQLFYIAFVVIGLATAGAGIWVLVELARGRPNAYRNALIVMLVGGVAAVVHMVLSQSVRGASAPVNMRVYITALTLALFLLFRLPPIWARADFEGPAGGGNSGAAAAGAALIVAGTVTLTTPLWVGATHLGPGGENWVDALWAVLQAGGGGMVLLGVAMLSVALLATRRPVHPLSQRSVPRP